MTNMVDLLCLEPAILVSSVESSDSLQDWP